MVKPLQKRRFQRGEPGAVSWPYDGGVAVLRKQSAGAHAECLCEMPYRQEVGITRSRFKSTDEPCSTPIRAPSVS